MRYYVSIRQPGGMGGSYGRTVDCFEECHITEYEWKSCVSSPDNVGVINTWLVETSEAKMCLFLLKAESEYKIICKDTNEYRDEEKFQNKEVS